MKRTIITTVILALTTVIFACDVLENEIDDSNEQVFAPINLSALASGGSGSTGTMVELNWQLLPGQITGIAIERREQFVASPLQSSATSVELSLLTWGTWESIASLPPGATTFADQTAGCDKNYEYKVCTVGNNGAYSCSLPIQA